MEYAKLNAGIITTVSGRWPRDLPKKRNDEYTEWLRTTFKNVNFIETREIAVNINDIESSAINFIQNQVDLVILIIGAFTGDNAAAYIGEKVRVPVIIWAPYEPLFDGGRIISNSLVAATMNMAAMRRLELPAKFIYGSYNDERVIKEISLLINVFDALKKVKSTFLGLLGYRPTAFYSSTFNETLIRRTFGLKMEEYDLMSLFESMKQIDSKLVSDDMEYIQSQVKICDLPDGYLENHSRLYLAIREFIQTHGFNALSIKCWPEMGQLKTTPCAMLSRMADEGFVIGCESDVDATITMLTQKYLTKSAPFMCDLITVDQMMNTALFWHCGQAGRCLKDKDSDICMRNHSLAGQGAVFETTLKEGTVTIARFSNIDNKYKLFIIKGEAVKTEKVVRGAMVNIMFEKPVIDVVYKIAYEGIPHHYSIIWDDVYDEMILFAGIAGIEVISL